MKPNPPSPTVPYLLLFCNSGPETTSTFPPNSARSFSSAGTPGMTVSPRRERRWRASHLSLIRGSSRAQEAAA